MSCELYTGSGDGFQVVTRQLSAVLYRERKGAVPVGHNMVEDPALAPGVLADLEPATDPYGVEVTCSPSGRLGVVSSAIGEEEMIEAVEKLP